MSRAEGDTGAVERPGPHGAHALGSGIDFNFAGWPGAILRILLGTGLAHVLYTALT